MEFFSIHLMALRIYGLLDCNNFFASCEKLFRPDLVNKPVVVLSNNDGVVIARSPEAKQLGITMGEAYFKIKRLAESGKITVFSSNFSFYGDISNRIMQMLYRWVPLVEVYSIDEAFLDFTNLGFDFETITPLQQEIVATIKKWTGISVSLGLGPTKTLAKVANDIAKKGIAQQGIVQQGITQQGNGICNLMEKEYRHEMLSHIEIDQVWGIGRRLAPKMVKLGIHTARDLTMIDPLWMRRKFGILLEQLIRELNGEHCIDLNNVPSPRKSIQVSRSFHDAVDDFPTLAEAVATFAAKACEQARSDGTVAAGIYVHLNTSRYKEPYFSESKAQGFDRATAHSPTVIRTALELLKSLFRQGTQYKKATVILLNLQDNAVTKSQGMLFNTDNKTPEKRNQEERLMKSVDQINQMLGKGKLFFGSQGMKQNWRGASEHRSPEYTTCWDELPVVMAK
ncbi:MAG: Y-family DNA polymerase [Planctomycetaceae bacterium]|jgi:DNA polymerase V|nr:Y-family DNA polymerase [Planctomycetaceae bacterium]